MTTRRTKGRQTNRKMRTRAWPRGTFYRGRTLTGATTLTYWH